MDNQEQVLLAYAVERGFHIEREFRFQESADLKIRRRFREMVLFVKKRRDVTAIIGYRVDRLTRNYRDHVLLDNLRLNHSKELHFVHDRLVITEKTVGREITEWDTKVYLAKSYLNRLKEEAIDSARYKLSRGELPGKAPYGYQNVRRGGKAWVTPATPEAQVVRRVFELYGAGSRSMSIVSRLVSKELSVKVSVSQVDRILANPFYCGTMRVKGKTYRHIYEHLVSRSAFDVAQNIKGGFHKKPFKYSGLPFSFRGIVRCGDCGCAVTPERKIKGDRLYTYYHCSQFRGKHGAAYLSETDATAQFQSMLDRLKLPLAEAERVASLAASRTGEAIDSLTRKKERLIAERTRRITNLETLYEDRLEGLISKEAYLDRKESADSEIGRLDEELSTLKSMDDQYDLTVERIVKLCSLAPRIFKVAKAEEKNEILKFLLSNCLLKGKKLLWELKKPFDTICECDRHSLWLPLTDGFRNKTLAFGFNLEELDAILELMQPYSGGEEEGVSSQSGSPSRRAIPSRRVK